MTYTLNLGGRLWELSRPVVMGILNATPDSFYAASRAEGGEAAGRRADAILREGGAIIDVGACSTRPGSEPPSEDEEMRRLDAALSVIRRAHPDAILSVDTYRSGVARRCVADYGVQIINDISGGALDPAMFTTAAELGVPYVLSHTRGTPQTMQQMTDYADLLADLLRYFAQRVAELRELGVADIILDPGFGFAKTVGQNFTLLRRLNELTELGLPLMVGLSRKSMIWRTLGCTPEEALNGTTVLHTLALERGAQILRAHDVRAAVEAVRLMEEVR